MSDRWATRQAARVFYTWSAQASALPLEIVDGAGRALRHRRRRALVGPRQHDLERRPRARPPAHAQGAGRGGRARPAGHAERRPSPPSCAPPSCWPRSRRPGLEKTFFCLSGAEANENAVKIARLVTGRKKIVARTRSYHGATLAMLSLSGDPRREPFEPGLPGVVRMADPYCFRCPFGKEPTSCAHECAAGSGDGAAARGAGHRRRRDPGGRSSAPTACSCRRPATGRRSARSAIATACC